MTAAIVAITGLASACALVVVGWGVGYVDGWFDGRRGR